MRRHHALLLVCGTLVLAPAAEAATNPQLSNTRLKASVTGLGGLVSALPGTTANRRLRTLVGDAQRSIKAGRVCEASTSLRSLRTQAAKQTSLTPRVRGDIAAASLNSEVVLLSRSAASSCGGPQTPSSPILRTQVLASSPSELKVRVAFPTPQFVGREGGSRPYAQLAMAGLGGGAIGKPEIPLARRAFAIPEGARVSFATSRRHTMTLRGVDLMPLQPGSDAAADPPITTFPGAHSPLFSTPAFARDPATYASRSPYPARTFTPRPGGDWRGFKLATFDVAGGQYAPASKVLKVATAVDVTIAFAGGTGKFNSRQAVTPTNRHMMNVFRATVVNAATAVSVANLKELVLKPCGEEVMIITEPSLRAAADRLAANKRARGLSTTVFEVGSAAGQVGTTAPAIYDFIRARRQADCGTTASFLILFGKGVPTFSRPNERDPTNPGKLVVGDFDYAVASPSFLLPVMHVGRIPANTLDQANIAVDKIEGWESAAPADANFYKRTSVAGFFQIDPGNTERESRDFIQQIERVRDGIVAGGSSADRFYVKDSGATPKYFADGTLMPTAVRNHGWNSTPAQIVAAINEGRSLIVHDDHGYTGGWGDPNLSTADIASMTNGNELPLMFSVNCSSGHFDDPSFQSFAEQMFLRQGGGAIGVIAGSRMTNTWANGFVALGLTDAVYPKTLPDFGGSAPITGIGEILTMGKIALWLTFPTDYQGDNGVTGDDFVRDHWRLYNLFGDPTVHIRLNP